MDTQERPCTRCVKRNISHLCHDEPREPVRAVKGEQDTVARENDDSLKPEEMPSDRPSSIEARQEEPKLIHKVGVTVTTTTSPINGQRDLSQLALSPSTSGTQSKGQGTKSQPCG